MSLLKIEYTNVGTPGMIDLVFSTYDCYSADYNFKIYQLYV